MTDESRWLIRDEVLEDRDLSGRVVDDLIVVNARLTRCDLRGLRVRHDASLGAGMQRSWYDSCVFDGSRLRMGSAGRATFTNCSFRDVSISTWECTAVSLIDCTFTGRLRGCSFFARVPDDYPPALERITNEIRGNDFSGCMLTQVYFDAGVDLARQRLPTGPEYFLLPDAPAALDAVRAEMAGWTDQDRGLGERLLTAMFDRYVRRGQTQIFGRRSEYARGGFEAVGKRIMDFWVTRGFTEVSP